MAPGRAATDDRNVSGSAVDRSRSRKSPIAHVAASAKLYKRKNAGQHMENNMLYAFMQHRSNATWLQTDPNGIDSPHIYTIPAPSHDSAATPTRSLTGAILTNAKASSNLPSSASERPPRTHNPIGSSNSRACQCDLYPWACSRSTGPCSRCAAATYTRQREPPLAAELSVASSMRGATPPSLRIDCEPRATPAPTCCMYSASQLEKLMVDWRYEPAFKRSSPKNKPLPLVDRRVSKPHQTGVRLHAQ